MAEIAPLRALRYADQSEPLGDLLCPPYDVTSDAERDRLYVLSPHNFVRVEHPKPGGDPYARAAADLATWRQRGVMKQDPSPAVYVHDHEFVVAKTRVRRRGIHCALRLHALEEGVVMPHEMTFPKAKADRLALLRATAANLESILLLAPDPDRVLAKALVKRATGAPAARAELDGVGIRLWVVTGDEAAQLARLAGRAQLYIADGHHRYETAVAYAREHPSADRVLSFIVSAGDAGLTILPTHRIIFGAGRDATRLVTAWRDWFDVGRVAPCMDRIERLAELGRERTACIVAFPGDYDVSLVLKRDAALDNIPGLGNTPAVRALDVARVETLVVQRILGAGTATPSLAYTPDARAAFDAVRSGRAAAAVLLNPTKVEEVFAVADAGDVMPPKSTYFVPKVPSGLVVRRAEGDATERKRDGR